MHGITTGKDMEFEDNCWIQSSVEKTEICYNWLWQERDSASLQSEWRCGFTKALSLRCTLYTAQLSEESVGIYHVKWTLYCLHWILFSQVDLTIPKFMRFWPVLCRNRTISFAILWFAEFASHYPRLCRSISICLTTLQFARFTGCFLPVFNRSHATCLSTLQLDVLAVERYFCRPKRFWKHVKCIIIFC